MKDNKSASLQDRIEAFLRNNRVILAILTTLVIVAIVAVVVGISISRNSQQREASRLYEIETAFSDWQAEIDPENPADPSAIIETLESERFRAGGYAYHRQLFLVANAYEIAGNYADAAEQYALAGDSRGFLGTTALLKSGLMLEAAGDLEAARAALTGLVEDFDTAEEPRVKFTLGRLSEALEDYEAARQWYDRVIADHSASGWADFAQNRLIALVVDGLISE
jgi:tetratricopeptide (TPR) repeat protein